MELGWYPGREAGKSKRIIMIKLETPTGVRYVKEDVIQEFGINESDPTNVIWYVVLKDNTPNAIQATVVVSPGTIERLSARHETDSKPAAALGACSVNGKTPATLLDLMKHKEAEDMGRTIRMAEEALKYMEQHNLI